MADLIDFLAKEFPNGCSIITPQFERLNKLEFEWKPQTEEEFYAIVNKAPWNILKGFGFAKWDTMNNVIGENQPKPVSEKLSIPIINKPNENFEIDLGRGSAPTTKLMTDEDIILIPGEWYDVIPNGFIVTGLYGQKYPFQKGKSDGDIRFGCLPYGITRQIESQ